MAFGLGPRASRVYESLRRSIAGGELSPGTKLPAHTELAQQFGVAPLTMRMVLGRLAERGLVSLEQGRGTFVRARTSSAVVLLAGDEQLRERLSTQIADAGYHAVAGGAAALARPGPRGHHPRRGGPGGAARHARSPGAAPRHTVLGRPGGRAAAPCAPAPVVQEAEEASGSP